MREKKYHVEKDKTVIFPNCVHTYVEFVMEFDTALALLLKAQIIKRSQQTTGATMSLYAKDGISVKVYIFRT